MFLSLTLLTVLHAVKVARMVQRVRSTEEERKKTMRKSRLHRGPSRAFILISVRTSEGEKRTETSEERRRVERTDIEEYWEER